MKARHIKVGEVGTIRFVQVVVAVEQRHSGVNFHGQKQGRRARDRSQTRRGDQAMFEYTVDQTNLLQDKISRGKKLEQPRRILNVHAKLMEDFSDSK